jgi:glyoxylase-like metal-dependent hydrolase (beta-lactamase superfamily II)
VLKDEQHNAVIIDPGCYSKAEQSELFEFIQSENLNLQALLGTHAHIDHVLGNAFVKRTFQCPYYLHEKDLPTLNAIDSYAHVYGFQGYESSPQPDFLLQGGEQLEFGGIKLGVLFTPGHAPGHVVFFSKENNFVINGDVLFNGSFGRVDLPGGDLETLKQSIFNTMFRLPEDTVVYCGHGPSTTIGKEKRSNYILNF